MDFLPEIYGPYGPYMDLLPEHMALTVHIGAVEQLNYGPYGPYRSCRPENMDRTVHI